MCDEKKERIRELLSKHGLSVLPPKVKLPNCSAKHIRNIFNNPKVKVWFRDCAIITWRGGGGGDQRGRHRGKSHKEREMGWM